MKNKLSKSRMQVIDSQSSSDYNAPTIPLTPHRPFMTHSSNNKVGYGYHSLIDDDSSARTSGMRTNETRSTKYLQRSDDSSCDEFTIRNSNLRSASPSRTLSSGSANNSDNSNKQIALVASNTTNDSSELRLPLPSSLLPNAKTMYGREKELAELQKRLSEGGALTSIYGPAGMGKTHLAIHAARRWLEERPFSRFVVWINAATEWTLRVSYLEALKQVLMGNLEFDGDDEKDEDAERGEIIIVAELLHQQLKQQRTMENVREAPQERRKRERKYLGSTSEDRQESESRGLSSCQVLTNDTSDWGEDGTVADTSNNGDQALADPMDTTTLAHLLWDSLLQGISTDYEWLVVIQNMPGTMGGVKGIAGLKPFLFPTGKTPYDDWLQGRILFTTRHKGLEGATLLGRIHSLRIDRLEESAAVRMLIANAVFDGDREMGRKNLASPWKEQIFQEAEKIGHKLVGPHYLDGSPLMISTAAGYIVSTGLSLKEYYSQLKHQVAVALEASGYGTGKVQSIVKRETSISVCLEQAMDNAHARDLGGILSAAAFVCAESIPVKLLGGDEDRVRMLCDLNLLTQVADQTYSMHRIHQRTAMDAIVTASSTNSTASSDVSEDEFLCTPDHAVLALRSAMSTFVADDASTWHDARLCLPHVEAIRYHHDRLESSKQLSPNFNHHFYAEIITRCASTLQWAMKDRPSAFSCFTEALRLQRSLFRFASSSDQFSAGSSSNVKAELAALLCKTLSSLGGLAATLDEAHEYHKEALDIFRRTFGEYSKSIELMTLYIALADVNEKRQDSGSAYEHYKKALELYFTIYGHNQDIYADDQKIFLAETLLKIGNLTHHQMQKHAEAQLYLEGAVSLLRHVYEGSNDRQDDLADAYETLGGICHAQGQLDDARKHYKSALSLKNSIHGGKKWSDISSKYGTKSNDGTVEAGLCRSEDDGTSYGSGYSNHGGNNIGDVRLQTRRNFTNEDIHEDLELVPISRESRKRAAAIRDTKLARTLHRLGVMAWNLGSLQQAEDYFEKALALQLSGYGVDAKNEDLAITLFSLGVLSNDLHNNQLKACSYYQKALDCYYFVHGPDSHNESIAQLLHALGQSLQILKKPFEAKVYFKKVCGLV
jgi:tetratricopeptide (TPR) repeat protein